VKKLFASLLLLTLAVTLSAPSFAQDAPKKDTTTKGKAKAAAKADDKAATSDEKPVPKAKAKGKAKTDKMDKEKTAPPKA
jgi:hypothetical protein